MPLNELGMKKEKTLETSKLNLYVSPPILNNLPLFGFDYAKLELLFEFIWRVLRVENSLEINLKISKLTLLPKEVCQIISSSS